MLKRLIIQNFRIFKEKQDFQIGKYVTMLSGWNALGKSTVLALLANSCELKKEDGTTYQGKIFRAKFEDILKGSKARDVSGNIGKIIYDNDKEKKFRVTWQKDRFRVIPGDEENDAKIDKAVVYLGLARLYPIGEADNTQIANSEQVFKNDDDRKWFEDSYKEILSCYDDKITSVIKVDIKDAHKSTGAVNTETYDWNNISAGQDNLSQILFAILSFKNLRKEQLTNFKGGILIIDELDATLHPKAQEKIVDLLIKEAKKLEVQIVFTTHSLIIIKSIYKRIKNSPNDDMISYYFTRRNNKLELVKNKPFEEIERELLVSPYKREEEKKLIIYTEDSEARWFLKKILSGSGYTSKIRLKDVNISCQSLIDLMNVEDAFKNYLTIFDGDLKNNDINRIRKNKKNYLKLPTTNERDLSSPEKVIRDFVFSEKAKEYFEQEAKKEQLRDRVKIEYFREHDIDFGASSKNERDKYKEWFNIHRQLFEDSNIMSYWKKENVNSVKIFIDNFKEKCELILKK